VGLQDVEWHVQRQCRREAQHTYSIAQNAIEAMRLKPRSLSANQNDDLLIVLSRAEIT
jgi:hypothetical protein